MQELEYENEKGVVEKIDYDIPANTIGLHFLVSNNKEIVILNVDGTPISMTISGARNLALALRQAANRSERSYFHLGKKFCGH
jgi:hypothetical protein